MPIWRATIDGQTGPIRIPYDDNGVTRYAIGNDANNPDVYKCCCQEPDPEIICDELANVTLELRKVNPTRGRFSCKSFRCFFDEDDGWVRYSYKVNSWDLNRTIALPSGGLTGFTNTCVYTNGALGEAGQATWDMSFYATDNCKKRSIGSTGSDTSQNDMNYRVWMRKFPFNDQWGVWLVEVFNFKPSEAERLAIMPECNSIGSTWAFRYQGNGGNGESLPNGNLPVVALSDGGGEAIVTWDEV